MERATLPQNGELFQEGGFWKLRWRNGAASADVPGNGHGLPPYSIGPAIGPGQLTEAQAQQIAWESILSNLDQGAHTFGAAMTFTSFVETKFVPEHVAVKSTSGRTHYKAILKHVLLPEEVDRFFGGDALNSKARLKAIPDWPYIGAMRLSDVRPDHVQRLIEAATHRGYSPQTVTHIRNVVGAVFSHAKKERSFSGENPASQVMLPGMTRKESHALTLAQAKEVIQAMHYPEKEMTLIAILTNLNVAEICGLQWKHVNLTEALAETDGDPIPPRSIAIRTQWYRGELATVKRGRSKILPIPQLLLPVLLRLRRRTRFTGPDDFVLVSQAGTPINQINIAARRLKSVGRELKMPWLSWHVFRRTHATLVYEFGMQFQHQMAMTVYADSRQELSGYDRLHVDALKRR